MGIRYSIVTLTILFACSATAASGTRLVRSAHLAYLTKLGAHRWRPIDVLYCLRDGRAEFCLGKNGRMYKVVRRTPERIYLRPAQQ